MQIINIDDVVEVNFKEVFSRQNHTSLEVSLFPLDYVTNHFSTSCVSLALISRGPLRFIKKGGRKRKQNLK